jgi:hypothetical protein
LEDTCGGGSVSNEAHMEMKTRVVVQAACALRARLHLGGDDLANLDDLQDRRTSKDLHQKKSPTASSTACIWHSPHAI